MATTIQLKNASRWYGQFIGLNEISLTVESGLVGLVGPNGAGKTTLLRLVTGLIRPSTGTVEVFGESVCDSVALRTRMGYCPEHDYFYENMTGLEFVTLMTRMYGFSSEDALSRADRTLQAMKLDETAYRSKSISQYSKGMRQKVKIAQALAHEPEVIILDEPFSGIDALSRHHIANHLRDLRSQGRTILLSSHVLAEVERVTDNFILIDKGRLIAQGNIYEVRALIDAHPHRIEIQCSDPQTLASSIVRKGDIPIGVHIEGDHTLTIHTPNPNSFYDMLPQTALEESVTLYRLSSPDNNLEAVFRYLTKA